MRTRRTCRQASKVLKTTRIQLVIHRNLSARTADPEPLDIPASSTRSCTEEADGPESCPGMLRARIHVHGDGNGSRRPGNVSEISDLSARIAESHMSEPVRLGS